jgi:hypothetical protein
VSGTLKVRLFEKAAVGDAEVIARPLADDLLLVLTHDHPDRIESATEGDFETALANTRAEPGLELTRHAVAGGELLMLSGDSFFVATHVLWAGDLDGPEPRHGTLVAVPNRNVVFAYPIRDRGVVAVLTPLLELARRFHAAGGAGAITTNLYWLRGSKLQRVVLEESAEHIVISPVSEFAALLNAL